MTSPFDSDFYKFSCAHTLCLCKEGLLEEQKTFFIRFRNSITFQGKITSLVFILATKEGLVSTLPIESILIKIYVCMCLMAIVHYNNTLFLKMENTDLSYHPLLSDERRPCCLISSHISIITECSRVVFKSRHILKQ